MKTLWKSLSKNMSPNGYKFVVGKWHKHEGKLKMCRSGFHCSKNIIDAILYVDCEWLAQVEVKGKHLIQDDKECWQEMRITKRWRWTKKMSVSLAIYAAELVLPIFEKKYPDDKRPRKAIEAAKRVLKADTIKNRAAARAAGAAGEAAWSAEVAGAAGAAAMAAGAAGAAAMAARAAGYAAWSLWAAWAAGAAGEAAGAKQNILKKCHNYIIKELLKEKRGRGTIKEVR